jgi:V/A-type H+-transporting ATPase subunit D
VKIPQFEGLSFEMERFSLFGRPSWLLSGVEILKGIAELRVKHKIVKEELDILEYARKKTTQKVNLYEKVQVPAFEEAIQKIKRFLEDEENLAKSSQKILKAKKARLALSQ